MCVYMYMYVCMYVCMYIYIYIYIYKIYSIFWRAHAALRSPPAATGRTTPSRTCPRSAAGPAMQCHAIIHVCICVYI